MAKISLADVLEKQKKVKVIAFVLILALASTAVALLLLKNPKNSNAAASWTPASLTLDATCTGTLFLYGQDVVSTNPTQNFSFTNPSGVASGNCSGTPGIPGGGYKNLNSDANITINGLITVVMYSAPGKPFKANNFTIMNGGILTHDALQPTDFTLPNRTVITSAFGIEKRVNLQVSGTLTLSETSQINVDGKGYPGGQLPAGTTMGNPLRALTAAGRQQSGFGPGGSIYSIPNDFHAGTGGGSFITIGTTNQQPAGTIYDHSLPATNPPVFAADGVNGGMQYGSGAGVAVCSDADGYDGFDDGGYGGGQIRILAKSIVVGSSAMVSANGGYSGPTGSSTPRRSEHNCESSSGGGSGGDIFIATSSLMYSPGTVTTPGGRFVSDFGPIYFLSAEGAQGTQQSGHINGGDGGDGSIVVRNMITPTIKKVFKPEERGGVLSTDFNAYGMQLGDRITVELNITNLTVGTDIFDDVPVTNAVNKRICLPVTGTITNINGGTISPPAAGAYDSTIQQVKWYGVSPSTTNGGLTLSYQCIVSKM